MEIGVLSYYELMAHDIENQRIQNNSCYVDGILQLVLRLQLAVLRG